MVLIILCAFILILAVVVVFVIYGRKKTNEKDEHVIDSEFLNEDKKQS